MPPVLPFRAMSATSEAPAAYRNTADDPGAIGLIREAIADVRSRRRLVRYLVAADMHKRGADTVLGNLWWVLDPLLQMVVYVVLVTLIARGHGIENYPLFIFAAILPWKWFSASITDATTSVTSQDRLIKQIQFPKIVLPVAATTAGVVGFIFGLVPLAALILVSLGGFSPFLLFLPVIAAVQFLFTLAFAFLMAAGNVFFRDLGNVSRHLLRLWFYLSPGLYSLAVLDEVNLLDQYPFLRVLLELNPFAILFEAYRAVIWGVPGEHLAAPARPWRPRPAGRGQPRLPGDRDDRVQAPRAQVREGPVTTPGTPQPPSAPLPDPALEAAPPPMLARSDAPVIVAEDLGVRYDLRFTRKTTLRGSLGQLLGRGNSAGFWALQHVSLRLQHGESLAVIGPNGAGKSTLLQVLAGIIRPSQGSVDVHGHVSGLLTLGAGFDQELSGRDNILLGGAFLGLDDAVTRRIMPSIIEYAELGEFIDAPLKTYSSGMRARLGFAIATSIDPDILLLDEVLATGDAAFRAKSKQRVIEIVKAAKAVVLVTHDMGWVTEYCNRALLIERGRVIMEGDPAEVVAVHQAHMEADRQQRVAAAEAAGVDPRIVRAR